MAAAPALSIQMTVSPSIHAFHSSLPCSKRWISTGSPVGSERALPDEAAAGTVATEEEDVVATEVEVLSAPSVPHPRIETIRKSARKVVSMCDMILSTLPYPQGLLARPPITPSLADNARLLAFLHGGVFQE